MEFVGYGASVQRLLMESEVLQSVLLCAAELNLKISLSDMLTAGRRNRSTLLERNRRTPWSCGACLPCNLVQSTVSLSFDGKICTGLSGNEERKTPHCNKTC
jgi:hypothetical protein